MPHIKHKGGHKGNGIKPQHHRELTKVKKALDSFLMFVSLTNSAYADVVENRSERAKE